MVSGRLLYFRTRFSKQRVDRAVQGFTSDMLVADDPFGVEHEGGRPGGHVPARGDGTLLMSLPPGTPGNLLSGDDLLELGPIYIAVHAEQCERFAFQPFH